MLGNRLSARQHALRVCLRRRTPPCLPRSAHPHPHRHPHRRCDAMRIPHAAARTFLNVCGARRAPVAHTLSIDSESGFSSRKTRPPAELFFLAIAAASRSPSDDTIISARRPILSSARSTASRLSSNSRGEQWGMRNGKRKGAASQYSARQTLRIVKSRAYLRQCRRRARRRAAAPCPSDRTASWE